MIPPQLTDGSSPKEPPDAEKLLYQFDQAWRNGPAPRIQDYVRLFSSAQTWNEPGPRGFLEELIKIDLEYRWRRDRGESASRPRLEDYVQQCPQLGRLDQVSEALIGGEYLVRHLWGDQPSHAEYARRFAGHGARLHETLWRIDGELSSEFRRGDRAGLPHRASANETADVLGDAKPSQPLTTTAALLDALRQSALLDASRQAELAPQAVARYPDSRSLARELMQRGWLTPYQVNQLLQGQGQQLVLGSYLLLERLGAGGAGQVFKARHQKLDRIVALKVIRKELLADQEVVARFYREIQVVSQLDHPNVVHAYDAGPVGSTHFLAMEYVEGTDLGCLVKQGGPLPVMQACEYIRQAALALQHAHERGLVHRDVKPHNLIMSRREGLIKLADLGLARLPRAVNEEATAALTAGVATTGTLTPANAVLIGTADYLAPEQALDFHAADIRADIYGLGCTFYYLLTGQPPFAATTMAEKLLKHQQARPPKLQAFRADVPSGVEAALLRMLAKLPEKRYQTPAEVAQALASFGREPKAKVPLHVAAKPFRKAIAAGAALFLVSLPLLFYLFRSVPGPGPSVLPDSRPSAAALRNLRALRDNPRSDPDELRKAILDLRLRYPGTPEAREAAALLMQLRSPFDRLEREKIPARARADWQPRELVAVLGEPVVPKGKKGARCYVALSPDGRWLASSGFASAGPEALIHLWDGAKQQMQPPIQAHREAITGLAFAPDGQTLASASWYERATVKAWNVRSRKELTSLMFDKNSAVLRLAFSPDGRTLALGMTDGRVRWWDTLNQKERTPVAAGGLLVRSMAFAPDGRTLAVADDSTTVQFCSADRLQETEKLQVRQRVRAVAYAPDGQAFALGGLDGLQLWRVSPRKKQHELQRAATMLTFSPDGQALAWSNGQKLFLSHAASGKEIQRWDFPDEDSITDLAFACDGRHLVVARNNATIYILRLAAAVPPGKR